MTTFVAGIDIGTGSTKGVVTTLDGTVVATAVREHAPSCPRPNWAEMDAIDTWWHDIVAVSRELTAQISAEAIAALTVSGIGPCFLPTDGDLTPTRPAILYGIDARAGAQIDELNRRFGTDEILRRGGTPLTSQAVGPKALWVRQEEPEFWAGSRKWFNANSFAVAKLTGEYVLDHHTASQCDPMYDQDTQTWNEPWAREILGHLPLPRLLWPHEVAGRLHAQAAAETGFAVGTPVATGTVDAWAEAFSAGVRRPGDLMLMYGSTMFFVQVVPQVRRDPLLWATCGVDQGSQTMAAGMSTSGSLTCWVRDLCGSPPFETLVEEAAATAPGADGLLMLPYFAGERTPIFDPRARGLIVGLSLRHNRAHLFRAAYESIAFGIRSIVDLLDQPDTPVHRLVAVGGGTKGGLWTQIVSDVTGRPQDIPEQTIGASYGDALLGAIGTGLVPPDTDWTRIATTIEPDVRTRELYDALYADYLALYPATREQMHRLARMQEAALAN